MFQWIDHQIRSKKKLAMPILSFPGTQILNVSVQKLVASGELQAACMKAIADRYPMAASVSTMDLSIEAEAFGAEIRISSTEVPTVTGQLIKTYDDAVALPVPPIGTKRTTEAFRAIEKSLESITDRPIFAGVIGPYSLAGRLMDLSEIMVKCLIEPETPHVVLRKTTDFLIKYISEFKKIGAHGIVLAEPVAGLLSPDLCSRFSSHYVRQIIDAVQDKNFIVIYHNCGNTGSLVDAIVSTGAKIFHLGNAVSIAKVIQDFPIDALVMGNIDPAGEFLNGNCTTIGNTTNELLRELSPYPNWVISSGCDIPPLTPLKNIDMFFNVVERYYRFMEH